MQSNPPVLALFQKRIDGDNALLSLASHKFHKCGLETELYGGDPVEFTEALNFRPEPFRFSVAHLSRDINLLTDTGVDRVVEFSSAFGHLLSGAVVHDQKLAPDQLGYYIDNIKKIFQKSGNKLPIFIEYASGLDTDSYLDILYSLKDIPDIGACIDVGHIGMYHIEKYYAQKHKGKNIFRFKRADVNQLKENINDIEEAVEGALPFVINVIKNLKQLNKHIHFHLHDGHPLSDISPYGLSDHLSFFEKIPIPFEINGKKNLNPMFGHYGLSEIIRTSLEYIDVKNLSFTLEVHPSGRRKTIDKDAHLFHHWKDLTNAEIMNDWLWELSRNSCLVKECF